jgi:hypothetical protein
MVRSNSLPEETLLHVQNDNIVQVTLGSQLERMASTILTAMQSAQQQNASGSEILQSSTATQNSHNPTADDGELMCDQRHSSEQLPPGQPSQRVRAPPGHDNSLPEAVASLHAAIQKIKINERDMKTLLEQTKSVLESKISEIDQRLEKTDTITTNVDSTTRSLVQLQAMYSWLQVELQVPPSVQLGTCSLCQRHSLQIRQHRGYSSM